MKNDANDDVDDAAATTNVAHVAPNVVVVVIIASTANVAPALKPQEKTQQPLNPMSF